MKLVIKVVFLLKLFIIMSLSAQTDYKMKLSNPIQIDNNSFEFDVIIKSLDTNFTLSSYQCSFSFDITLSENDSIVMQYVEKSSELANSPINVVGHLSDDGINELIFTSGIGNDQISIDSLMVGKFVVIGSMDLSIDLINMIWNFEGSINTILTGKNFEDITVPANHVNFDNTITNLKNEETIPSQFEISQNYPNPFNPTTKIDFKIPKKGNVKLTLFNTLGERVKTIINRDFSSGKHSVHFDGRNFASGTYFYTIEYGEFVKTKKMILLK